LLATQQVPKKRHSLMKLTTEDLALADAIIRFQSIKAAAQSLGLNLDSVYNRARAIRNQVRKAIRFNNQVLNQCRRHPKIKSFWWPKSYEKPVKTEEEEQEENEF